MCVFSVACYSWCIYWSFFFFFKQKTAYEMRISDWSSDVCSSDPDDAATYEIALVENIQRQDLNAIEEASAYRRLIEAFGHNQEALATLVGKSRSHVANLMRLLDLPASVQALVGVGSLAMEHARALIGADDAEAIGRRLAQA